MTIAGRKGKLSISGSDSEIRDLAWERYEDVLTSDVFGVYRYLPPKLGILPFLSHAVDETGQSLGAFLSGFGIVLEQLDVARFRFWPTFGDGREPDLLVKLESYDGQQSVGLLVEAKLDAGQHTINGRSQIGHYLCQHIQDAYGEGSVPWEFPELPRPLLFVTRHLAIPKSELRQARVDVRQCLPDLPESQVGVFWVSWFHAAIEAERLWRNHRRNVETSPWLRLLFDLREELRVRDLVPRAPFRGFRIPARLPQWSYDGLAAARIPSAWNYDRTCVERLPVQVGAGPTYQRQEFTVGLQAPRQVQCYERGLHDGARNGGMNGPFYNFQEDSDD